jgi:hypothetical protein
LAFGGVVLMPVFITFHQFFLKFIFGKYVGARDIIAAQLTVHTQKKVTRHEDVGRWRKRFKNS